jgi:hypothetical protein
MSLRGYSFRLVEAIRAADPKHIGVRLGKYSIAKDIPVTEIAEYFSVSRMTVYQWFTGASTPHKDKAEKIKQLLKG